MLTCKDASRLISERQERPLGVRERWSLRFHLLMCVYCRRFARQVELIRRALQFWGRQDEPGSAGHDFPPEARERIRQALAERRDHEH